MKNRNWKPAKRIGYRAYEYNGYTIEYNEDVRGWSIFTIENRQWVDTWDTLSACKTAIRESTGGMVLENN